MDDQHEQAILLQKEYEDQVSFYLGCDLDSLSSPEAKPLMQAIAGTMKEPTTPSKELVNLEQQTSENVDNRYKMKGLRLSISTGNGSDWLRVSPGSRDQSSSPVVPYSGVSSSLLTSSSTSSLLSLTRTDDHVRKSGQLFEEHEKMFQEEILPLSPGTPRTPWRSNSRSSQSIAFDHLENLMRMLEQLSQVHEENTSLKRKCAFLEDTRSLLQLRNEMLSGNATTKAKSKWSPKSYYSPHHGSKNSKGKLSPKPITSSSSPFFPPLRISTYPKARPHMLNVYYDGEIISNTLTKSRKRSQSVGSLDTLDTVDGVTEPGSKGQEKGKCEVMKASRKKFSKWERVKMVFSGKPDAAEENLSPGKSKQLHRPSSPSVLVHQASVDLAVESATMNKTHSRHPQIHAPKVDVVNSEPPSPGSTHSEPAIFIADTEGEVFEDLISPQIVSQEMSMSKRGNLRRISKISCDSIESVSSTEDDMPSLGSRETLKDEKSGGEEDETVSSQHLQVEALFRRGSSPVVWTTDTDEPRTAEDFAEKSSLFLRSSSFKYGRKQSMNGEELKSRRTARSVERGEARGRYEQSRRTAWRRVKDIIHTRRDSIKIRSKRDSESRSDAQSDSEAEKLNYYDDFDSSPAAMEYECKTPTASPPTQRKSRARATSPRATPVLSRKAKSLKTAGTESPPRAHTTQRPASTAFGGISVDITALLGGMSDDFSKKMQEWEDKKSRKNMSLSKESIESEDLESQSFSEEFIRKMEEWEKIKGISYESSPNKGRGSDSFSPDKSSTPTDLVTHPPPKEELQQTLSESFSKKLQEWERIKSQRAREGSPVLGEKDKDRKSKKEDKNKSKKDHDKSKQKAEKVKGKEKSGFEKVKETLSEIRVKGLTGMELALSDIRREGLSDEFTKKLHEWEQIKGVKQEHSEMIVTGSAVAATTDETAVTSTTIQSQHTCTKEEQICRERIQSDNSILETSQFSEYSASSFVTSTQGMLDRSITDSALSSSPHSLVDDGTSIDLSITSEHVSNLEKTNARLLEELKQKEEEDTKMKNQIKQLQDRINMMNNKHQAEIETYKRELWATSHLGHVTIETDLLAATMTELKQKIEQLESQGDLLAEEKSKLEMQMFQESVDRCQTEARLVEEIQKLRHMISNTNKDNQSSYMSETGGEDYDKLYDYVLSLQMKLNDLKHGMMERNQLIGDMRRHLMMQEVTNILTKAGMNRCDLELSYFKEAKRLGVLRRWKTFAGAEYKMREDQKSNGNVKQQVIPRHHVRKTCKDYETIIERLINNNGEPVIPSFECSDGRQAKVDSGEGNARSPPRSPKGLTPDGHQLSAPVRPEFKTIGVQVAIQSQHSSTGVQFPEESQLLSSVGIQVPVTPIQLSSMAVQTSDANKTFATKAAQSVTVPVSATLVQTEPPSTEERHTQTVRTRDENEIPVKKYECKSLQTDIIETPKLQIQVTKQPETTASDSTAGMTFPQPNPRRPTRFRSSKQMSSALSSANSSVASKTTSNTTSSSTEKIMVTKRTDLLFDVNRKWTSNLTSKTASDDSSPGTGKQAVQVKQKGTVSEGKAEPYAKTSERCAVTQGSKNQCQAGDSNCGETLSDWLKREPKPPQVLLNDGLTTSVTSADPEILTTDDVTTCLLSASPVKTHQQDRQGGHGAAIERALKQDSMDNVSTTSTDDSDVFVDAKTHLPYSPMIRSKNPRKWRQEPECAQPVNVCTFQATPPRRHIRHRRGSVDKLDSEASHLQPGVECDPRGRTRMRQSNIADSPRAYSVDARFQNSDPVSRSEVRLQSRKRLPNVQAAISKFEKHGSAAEITVPYRTSAPSSPSLGPPRYLRVSPVRRQKPAAELMQEGDSQQSRHSKSKKGVMDQTEVVTTAFIKTRALSSSSDKENTCSKVQHIVRHFSREGTPLRSSISSLSETAERSSSLRRTSSPEILTSDIIQQAVTRLSLSTSDCSKTKPILKDLTNEGQVKKITETLRNGSIHSSPSGGTTPTGTQTPVSRASPARSLGEHKWSLEGIVHKCTELFERKSSLTTDSGRKTSSRKSSLSESNILKVKSDSLKSVEKREKPLKVEKRSESTPVVQRSKSSVKRRSDTPEATDTDIKKRNRSVSPSKARRFFSRNSKQTQQNASQGVGVISALCRQTMAIDSDKVSIESEQSSRGDEEEAASMEGGSSSKEEKRRVKGKFLDGNWLNKPKRFFRVSNTNEPEQL